MENQNIFYHIYNNRWITKSQKQPVFPVAGWATISLTCIAGGMAEAMYGVPEELAAECRRRLPEDMIAVLDRFETVCRDAGRPSQDKKT